MTTKKKLKTNLTFIQNDEVKVISSKTGTHINFIFDNGECLSLPKLFLKTILLSADKRERNLQKKDKAA